MTHRMCKCRLDGVREEQSKHISQPSGFKSAGATGNVPTVLGEPPSIIFKPLTTAMQMPERPGKVKKKRPNTAPSLKKESGNRKARALLIPKLPEHTAKGFLIL